MYPSLADNQSLLHPSSTIISQVIVCLVFCDIGELDSDDKVDADVNVDF